MFLKRSSNNRMDTSYEDYEKHRGDTVSKGSNVSDLNERQFYQAVNNDDILHCCDWEQNVHNKQGGGIS